MTSMLVTATDQRLLAALAGGSWAEVVGLAAVGGTGAGLGVASVLDSVDPGSLEGGPRVDLVRAWGRVLAMIEGRMQVALASLVDATDALGVAGEQARHEVAAALKLAPATASIRTRVAADLRDRLPDTLRALEAGDISYRQAAAIVDAVRELTDDIATKVEAEVLSGAFRQTLGQTHRSLKRALLLIDPDGAAARRQAALARRSVDRIPQLDSMQAFRFSVPATIGHDWWGVLSSRARDEQLARRELGRDDPGLDALRVDVLVQALLGNGGADPLDPLITCWLGPDADSGRCDHDAHTPAPATPAPTTPAPATPAPTTPAPATPSPRPSDHPDEASEASDADEAAEGTITHVPQRWSPTPRCSCGGAQVAAVVVDLPTLLGFTDNPGELAGYGAIPGDHARAMAWDRDWVRWTVDPVDGALLDRGAERYRPSDRLRAFVAARDRVCGFPSCSRPAHVCDCDHIAAFRHDDRGGGRTIRANLGPLCRQHHNAKTHGRWRLTYDAVTRVKTWLSPLGRTYTTGTDPPLR